MNKRRKKLNKKRGPEGPYKHTQGRSIHLGVNKTFGEESPSHKEFSEQKPPGRENKNDYVRTYVQYVHTIIIIIIIISANM